MRRTDEWAISIAAVAAAYALLAVVWAISRGLSHSYSHWIEGVGFGALPWLTVAVLPAIDVAGGSTASILFVSAIWLLLAIWPALGFVYFIRRSDSSSGQMLALSLLSWLFVLLSAAALVAVGLWLPFSLL